MSTSERLSIDVVAHCACGSVRVAARGEVLSMFLCACEDCQRASGSGHAAALLMRAGDVAVAGETLLHEVEAASGARMARRRCADCGTPVSAQSSRAEALVTLPAGLFGSADWFRPRHLLFARSLRGWDAVDPALPRHQTYPHRETS